MSAAKNLFPRPGIQIQLAEKKGQEEAISTDIQIIRTGVYQHAWYGEFQIAEWHLKSFVQNFNDKVMKNDLMIDYNHDVDEAAAWVKELYLKNNDTELWAKVDWTPEGARCVQDKEYRYISADFHFEHKDNESGVNYGPTLYGAALTNRPFVKGMAPTVELNETNGGNPMDPKKLQEENKQLSEKVEKLSADHTAEVKRLSEEAKAKDEQIKKLSDEVAQLKTDGEKAKKEADFAVLLSEGKAVPAQKDAFMKGDMTEFAKLAGTKKLNTQEKGSGAEGEEVEEETDGDDEDKNIELAETMVKEGKAKNMAEALSIVLNTKKSK